MCKNVLGNVFQWWKWWASWRSPYIQQVTYLLLWDHTYQLQWWSSHTYPVWTGLIQCCCCVFQSQIGMLCALAVIPHRTVHLKMYVHIGMLIYQIWPCCFVIICSDQLVVYLQAYGFPPPLLHLFPSKPRLLCVRLSQSRITNIMVVIPISVLIVKLVLIWPGVKGHRPFQNLS